MEVVLVPKEDHKKYYATDTEELGSGAAGQAARSPM